MRATVLSKRSGLALLSVFVCLSTMGVARVGAQVCANDPSRTIFAGGPNTEACDQFDNDQSMCEKAFHLSGAGHFAPCVFDGGDCFGNTAQWIPTEAQSCEALPPQSCADRTRTIKLTGGATARQGNEVCGGLNDQETCEMAWHTSAKGVGISCCWTGSGCAGSVWGFFNGNCTQRNTCFQGAKTAPAPALSPSVLFAIGTILFGFGAMHLRSRHRQR